MRSEIRQLLRSAARYCSNPQENPLKCKMCHADVNYFGTVDFSKNCGNLPLPPSGVAVNYYQCITCEFLFTDMCDDWEPSDFREFIYNSSYIVVDPDYTGERGVRTAKHLLPALEKAGRHASILDFGAGNGLFAETLRQRGFARVLGYDPYAGGEKPADLFDIVTCFEVIEHTATPIETLDTMLAHMKEDGCLLFGQTMIPENIGELGTSWWYMAPRNGHISFYSHRTILQYAASRGLTYRSFGTEFVLHKANVSEDVRQFLAHFRQVDLRILQGIDIPNGAGGWEGLEHDGQTHFCWTNRNVVPLGPMHFEERPTFISIPVAMVIDTTFWKDCVLQIGSQTVPLHKLGSSLSGQFLPQSTAMEYVSLITPHPRRPCDISGSSDERSLGLAIHISPPCTG